MHFNGNNPIEMYFKWNTFKESVFVTVFGLKMLWLVLYYVNIANLSFFLS